MTEKHNMKSLRTLAVCVILVNIFGNILFYLNLKRYYFPSLFDGINIDIINIFTSFTLITLAIGTIFNKSPKLSEEDSFKVKSKLRPLLFLNIFFIAYILITILVFKNISLFISSLIVETSYIAIIIYSKIIYSLLATDSKLKWKQAFTFWVYPVLGIFNRYIRSFFALIEYIFGLYTSLTGICTGIDEFSNNGKHYFRVYVTDFVHKREIVYETYDTPYFNKNSKVKLIHGIFSKKVIIVNNIRITYR